MAKPIFLFGIPNKVDPNELDRIQRSLKKYLTEYYVIAVRNTDEKYIAKVYSERGSDVMELENIEKLLKTKL